MKSWEELKFWQSGEWQVLKERFDDWDQSGRVYNPGSDKLFASLAATPYTECRVAIIGQDPYPNRNHCTGLAFSVPRRIRNLPPSVNTILMELKDDLGYSELPTHGDLSKWAEQGVLLWNCCPTCDPGSPASHSSWPEWPFLTAEIVEKLDEKGCVFAFVGSRAQAFARPLEDRTFPDSSVIEKSGEERSSVLKVGHPSPLGRSARTPFRGSRIFSKINHELVQTHGLSPINWRL